MQGIRQINALNATTITATSNEIYIGSFKRVALRFRAASITSGNGVFTVKMGFAEDAGVDPTMVAYSMLIDNVANTNAQQLTRVASKTLSSNGDVIVWLTPEAMLTHITVTATVTTDGAYSADIFGFDEGDC